MKILICAFNLFLVNFFWGNNVFCQEDLSGKCEFHINHNTNTQHSNLNEVITDTLHLFIQVHIIGDKIDYEEFLNILQSKTILLNQQFSSTFIQFHICNDVNFIFIDNLGEEFILAEDEVHIMSFLNPSRINFIFVDKLFSKREEELVQLCGHAISDSNVLRSYFRYSCFKNDDSLLAHELGHNLTLPHTHSRIGGDELVKRDHCSTTGDLFCDTPADPELSSASVSDDCFYVGDKKDRTGEAYMPDTKNIMSYSRSKCKQYFSEEQSLQMQSFIKYGSINNISCNTTSIDFLFHNNLSIFPNPSSNSFRIKLSVPNLNLARVEIYSMTGYCVEKININDGNLDKDVSLRENGIYHVFLITEKYKLFLKRIVKI